MSERAPEATPEASSSGSERARLAAALGAAFLLAVIVGIVLATGGSDEGAGLPTGTCFVAWNDDPVAPIQDGQHAYAAHGYRQTLVTRLDRDGEIISAPDDEAAPDDPNARCAVIFASPQPDFEPDFGVRVLDEGRWTTLAIADKASLDEIADLQAEAVADSNAILTESGKLGAD